MGDFDDDSGAAGHSRRRWLTASAVLVAGSAAAGRSSGARATTDSLQRGESKTAPLPGADAARRTDQIKPVPQAAVADRFRAWNDELRAHAAGREAALVDLDSVDHNLKLVGTTLGSRIGLRLVAKSLPCIPLLEYMMVTAGTNRVMAFSEGMVQALLYRFGSGVDVLLGRPAAVQAADRTFSMLDARGTTPNPAASVRWLVDTAQRMEAYASLAERRDQQISVAVEIDVGLRRGGARDEAELLSMLAVIDDSPHLRFGGFMGYEGHIPFAAMGGLTPDDEFAAVQRRYTDFVEAGGRVFPEMFDDTVVFNSGGSRTYHYYTDEAATPVNEVAMGSAFFYPGNFHNLPQTTLSPATFFATPVLKRLDPAEVPFDPEYLPGLAQDHPEFEVSFFMTAGDFPGEQIFPEGLAPSPTAAPAVEGQPRGVLNMLPNQGRWLGPRSMSLRVGDFLFYQPWEGDAIRWLKYLDVFRGSRMVDQWPTFQPGIRANPAGAD